MKKKYKGIISFDFDRTISTRNGEFKSELIGERINNVIMVMNILFNEGYYITIFTGRPVTQTLLNWLAINDIPYHSINDLSHNPKGSNFKCYAHCYIDDRGVNPIEFSTLKYKSVQKLYIEILKTVKLSKQNIFKEK